MRNLRAVHRRRLISVRAAFALAIYAVCMPLAGQTTATDPYRLDIYDSRPSLVRPSQFQFNVVVPAGLGNGDQAITATYNGASTQAGTLLTVHN